MLPTSSSVPDPLAVLNAFTGGGTGGTYRLVKNPARLTIDGHAAAYGIYWGTDGAGLQGVTPLAVIANRFDALLFAGSCSALQPEACQVRMEGILKSIHFLTPE